MLLAKTASLSLDGNTFSIQFRHPCIRTRKGDSQLKVHKSLKTNNKLKAESILTHLNILLNTPTLWDISNKPLIEQSYGELVADIFYKPMMNNLRCARCYKLQKECTCPKPLFVDSLTLQLSLLKQIRYDVENHKPDSQILKKIDILNTL